MDNYANKDFYELLAELDEQDKAREAEEKGQGKHVPLLDSFMIQHYKGLDFSRYLQLYGYAKALHAEACKQGDIQKVESFEKYVRLLATVYEELKEYELILWEDCMDIKVNPRICGKDLRRVLFTMKLFIDNYHRIEHISKAISEPGQTGEHGGSGRNQLPSAIDTPRAHECFMRAEEKGYMEKTDTGHRWTFGDNRGKARLAYFLERVYCPHPEDKMTSGMWRSLEKHFGTTRLDSAASQNVDTAAKQATVKKWRAEIDEITPRPKAE